MENFKRATINENAIKNFREQARYQAAKERVVHAALSTAAKQVVALFGPNISLDASKDTLTEIRPDIFTGKVEAQLSMETATGLKRIAYPIEVCASYAILPDDIVAKANIEDALKKTASDLDEKLANYESKIDEKVASISEEESYNKELTAEMENGLSLQEAQMFIFNKKASQSLNVIPGEGASADANIGINVCPQHFIRIAKHKLPTYNVGDSLDVCGTPYVCVKVGETDVEFQLQVL